MSAFRIEQDHPTVVTVRMDGIASGWERWFLLRSDAHHDNAHADHALEREHLEQAKTRGAGILDFGDLFCAMQGKWDKRADQRQLIPELRESGKPYRDALMDYNAAFYAPYAENFILLAPGNHETGFLKRHETNLTECLAERMRAAGSGVRTGTYQGWVQFRFHWNKSKQTTLRLRYTHGYAGGGPVTKDVIQTARQLAYLGNADLLVSGHTHDGWQMTIRRETLDHRGIPRLHDVECLKCPGYKDEFSPGEGWAVERGMGPKPKGAWWVRFWMLHDEIRFECVRAK
jgi:hypothetical protein